MALPSAVVEEGVNKMVSYISTKLDDKALTADTIASTVANGAAAVSPPRVRSSREAVCGQMRRPA
jgi:hypothetical protein